MAVITLLSDFGISDYYPALIKAKILAKTPDAQFIDISNNIEKHNLVQAAFFLKQSYKHFPSKTIHLISVQNWYESPTNFLLVKYMSQYFIGPDNGILSLALEQEPELILVIPIEEKGVFPFPSIFSKYVYYILNDKLKTLPNRKLVKLKKRLSIQPAIGDNYIRGTVIFIDHFGNIIFNIHRDIFELIQKDRKFKIFIAPQETLTEICKKYNDVSVGEVLVLFNSANYLEVSINMGDASRLLAIDRNHTINIEFS